MKYCNKCNSVQVKTAFCKNKRAKDGLCAYCKNCMNKQTKTYKEQRDNLMTKEEISIWNKQRALKYMYGITFDAYTELLKKQAYKCRVCGTPEAELDRKLAVDHDHVTGKVRALLCVSCNNGLGRFKDSPVLLRIAALYLEETNKMVVQ